jgi:hypothetical protein
VALSILYISCPGVLGTIYTQDLYMTWMTLPFAPIAVYGVVRGFQHDDVQAQICLGFGLGSLWLCHAPIAMWLTLVVGGLSVLRLCWLHRTMTSWKRAMVGATLLFLIAQYPFVSVASIHSPGAPSPTQGGLERSELIVASLRETFPATLLPVSSNAQKLSDLQFGYGLWAILLIGLFCSLWLRQRAAQWVLLSATAVLALLFPIPGFSDWFWVRAAPGIVQKLTYYWPMHRLYLVASELVIFGAQLAFGRLTLDRTNRSRCYTAVLLIATAWSLWESRQFVRAGLQRTASPEISAQKSRLENLPLMNHAYGLFDALPAYFSNGVMDPNAEVRLLDAKTMNFATDAVKYRTISTGLLRGSVDANPGILNLSPSFKVEPGKHYRLSFLFGPQKHYHGILQIVGTSFFREYELPLSGEPLSFGSTASAGHDLYLWTTSSAPEDLHFRFISTSSSGVVVDLFTFASFTWSEWQPKSSSVELVNLTPFTANLRLASSAWMETPRMFMPGYEAKLDNRPIAVYRSPQGLAMVSAAEGTARLVVEYLPPLELQLSYWISVLAWIGGMTSMGWLMIAPQSRNPLKN